MINARLDTPSRLFIGTKRYENPAVNVGLNNEMDLFNNFMYSYV